MTIIHTACLLVLSALSGALYAEQINVAVASNFTAAMKDIVAQFERSSGHRVILSSGSSGKFFAQIKHGAPFQVFFSADQVKPKALEQQGLIVPGTRFTYAIGALALWSQKPGFINDSAERLKSANFKKLALANPELAPYGAAAVEVLKNLKLKEATETKWVRGENIAQTYQFISSGSVEMGFVALSQIFNNGKIETGSSWIIPTQLYNPIRQDAVLLRSGDNSKAAHALLRFFRSKKATEIIQSYGYKTEFFVKK